MAINTSKGAAWAGLVQDRLADWAQDEGRTEEEYKYRVRAIQLFLLSEKLRRDEENDTQYFVQSN